jgi:hypothetical protein
MLAPTTIAAPPECRAACDATAGSADILVPLWWRLLLVVTSVRDQAMPEHR